MWQAVLIVFAIPVAILVVLGLIDLLMDLGSGGTEAEDD
jgi:hypothetical protein